MTLRPRNVIEVLATLPDAQLRAVRAEVARELERMRAEIRRLEVEREQIDAAIQARIAQNKRDGVAA